MSILLWTAWGLAAATPRAPFGASFAADLDGDRQTDFATAGALRADSAGSGYLLEISLRLSGQASGTITVRTAQAAGRIWARDLDGDADRDLILESFDRVPLAIVLNDGGGRFHQVGLEEYPTLAHKPDPLSFEAPTHADESDGAWATSTPAAAIAPSASSLFLERAEQPLARDQRHAATDLPARPGRAPPSSL